MSNAVLASPAPEMPFRKAGRVSRIFSRVNAMLYSTKLHKETRGPYWLELKFLAVEGSPDCPVARLIPHDIQLTDSEGMLTLSGTRAITYLTGISTQRLKDLRESLETVPTIDSDGYSNRYAILVSGDEVNSFNIRDEIFTKQYMMKRADRALRLLRKTNDREKTKDN